MPIKNQERILMNIKAKRRISNLSQITFCNLTDELKRHFMFIQSLDLNRDINSRIISKEVRT